MSENLEVRQRWRIRSRLPRLSLVSIFMELEGTPGLRRGDEHGLGREIGLEGVEEDETGGD